MTHRRKKIMIDGHTRIDTLIHYDYCQIGRLKHYKLPARGRVELLNCIIICIRNKRPKHGNAQIKLKWRRPNALFDSIHEGMLDFGLLA